MTRLVDALLKPSLLSELSLAQLSAIIAEARFHNMLCQLGQVCQRNGCWNELPEQFRTHIVSAEYAYEKQQSQLRYEVDAFDKCFKSLEIQWVYLKGAAYHLSRFTEFGGRVMADIDILVAEDDLVRVESLLKSQGWITSHINDYDEKFYREWSQEIPPMRHSERRTELDIHFNILPKTLKETPSPDVLMEHTASLKDEKTNARVFAPEAMIIHSAIHLFFESEFHKGFRDLHDLYILISRFQQEDGFWNKLIDLQKKVGNGTSVYYGLRYCKAAFNLEVPDNVFSFYENFKPNPIILFISDFAFKRVFLFPLPAQHLRFHKLAELVLYYRGHLKRMPIHLLLPHLVVKSFKKLKKEKQPDALRF